MGQHIIVVFFNFHFPASFHAKLTNMVSDFNNAKKMA